MKLSMSAQPHALDTLILGSIEEESEPCDRDSRKNKIKVIKCLSFFESDGIIQPMVGFSNGGMLTYRFAAERGDFLAAAAPMAASIGGRPSEDLPEWRIPEPVRPIPII